MSQAFYRKWRPQKWDQVIAQDHVIQTLRNAVRSGRVGHAYLLAGPRGTGKTTTARLLAKAVNCLDPNPANRPCDECAHCKAVNEGRFLDLVEIDAASNTSVEDVRDLRDKINYRPSQGEFKVYIIDEVHMLSTAAFNALLKTLEEPPPHAKFILATTEVQKIPATILSRCQRYDFRRIPVPEIVKYLGKMAKEEGIQVDEDALTVIARQATGAMRDAVSLLDQLASTGGRVTVEETREMLGTTTSALVIDLVDHLLEKQAGAGLKTIQAGLDSGTDARQYARQVVDYLRGLLLIRMGNIKEIEATREQLQQMKTHADRFETPRLLEAIRAFNAAAVDARSSWHPGLALELAFAESIQDPAAAAITQPAAAITQPAAVTQPAAINLPVNQPAATITQPAAQPIPARTEAPPAKATPQPAPARNETPPAKASAQPAPAKDAGLAQTQPSSKTTPHEPRVEEPPASKPARAGSTTAKAPAAPEKPASGTALYQKAAPDPQVTAVPQATPAPQGAATPGAATPGAAASQPASGAGKTVTQHDVQQNWPRIKQMVKKRSAMTEGLLNSARSVVLKNDTLVLGFQSEVVKSKMETKENVELLRQALQAALGASLAVRCVVVGSRSSSSDLDIDGDGMVGAALDLGGEIVMDE